MPRSVESQSTSVDDDVDELVAFCVKHPKIVTRLRCGKCDQPICPKCMVYTPVGVRCRPCANLKRPVVFQAGPRLYAQAIGVAVLIAVALGWLWAVVGERLPFISLWFVVAVGAIVGELVSKAAKRRRTRGLQVVALAAMLGALVVRAAVVSMNAAPDLALNDPLLIEYVIDELTILSESPFDLILVALGGYTAVRRI